MRDGFYLFCYIDINPLAYCLNLPMRHDQTISLFKKVGHNVRLVHYWELERLTGFKKHHTSFYSRAHADEWIDRLLSIYSLKKEDMVEIVGVREPHERNLQSNPRNAGSIPEHTYAHLFSGLLSETAFFIEKDILVISADAGPDEVCPANQELFAAMYSQRGKMSLPVSIDSPAPLWSFMKQRFAMEEGSLMALAAASKSKCEGVKLPLIKNWRDIISAQKWLDNVIAMAQHTQAVNPDCCNPLFSKRENLIADVVKTVQDVSERMFINNIDMMMKRHNINPHCTSLSIVGGYGLNCVSNTKMMQHFGFQQFISPPCVSDSGIALGYALRYFYEKDEQLDFSLGSAYAGDSDVRDVDTVAAISSFEGYIEDISDFDGEKFISDIDDNIVLWYNGRSEMGPRALGNRSLLGDPRSPGIKTRLNKIKQRQWWRPVAPVILEEYVSDWYQAAFPSPYMLNSFKISESKRHLVPAVLHLDDCSRIQTLLRNINPDLYRCIEAFYRYTGIPMLCNTSLNDCGEPIINTIDEAIYFSLVKQISVAYINGKRVQLHTGLPMILKDNLLRQGFAPRELEGSSLPECVRSLNPLSLDDGTLMLYFASVSLQNEFTITNKRDARLLQRIASLTGYSSI